jgi:hypothetical protein
MGKEEEALPAADGSLDLECRTMRAFLFVRRARGDVRVPPGHLKLTMR